MNRKFRCSALLFLLLHVINYAQPHETEDAKHDCKKSNKTCLSLFSLYFPAHNHSTKPDVDAATTHAPKNGALDITPLLLRDKKVHQPSRNVSKGHAKGQAARTRETWLCWLTVYLSALWLLKMVVL